MDKNKGCVYCFACKDHKGDKPLRLRADNGEQYEFSYISYCPYCGRYLQEFYDYNRELALKRRKELEETGRYTI